MEEIKNISKALVEFHKESNGLVPFDSRNPYFNSQYSSLGAVISYINKHAPKHGLSWVQLPVSGDGGIGVETIILHESGESIKNRILVPFSEMTTKLDKEGEQFRITRNVAQEAGAVITYLRRYGLASAFGLYADEDNDANSVEQEKTEMVVKKTAATIAKAKRPYAPETLVANLKKMANKSLAGSDRDRQTLAAVIAQFIGDDEFEEKRHDVQEYLFGERSIKDVDPKMISAGLAWLTPEYDKEAKTYYVNPYSVDEINLVLDEVLGYE